MYLYNEHITNGYNENILELVTIFSIICGTLVIVSKNPVVSVLFLIGLFLSISVYLMILGINFIGLSYLLVYVGAVSILFLFILMLINVRISEIVTTTSNNIPLGVIVGILFLSQVYKALPISNYITYNTDSNYESNTVHFTIKDEIYKYFNGIYNNIKSVNNYSLGSENVENIIFTSTINNSSSYDLILDPIYLTYSQVWDSMLTEVPHINTIGNLLYTVFPVWILLTSLILLLAMVGTILITLRNQA